jgi:ApaG protein
MNVEVKVTNGIKISVETSYQPEYSKPIENKYIFAYRITIENLSDNTVQLMRRHWYIVDSNGMTREVEGEGVIGQQPILTTGERHQYVSWSHLFTEIGKMHGFFTFIRQLDGTTFKATIPEFQLMTPFKMN